MSVGPELAALALLLAGTVLIPGTRNRLAAAIVMLAALGGYFLVGEPGRSDAPLAGRIAQLRAADPARLTSDERLALWRFKAREQPDNPSFHTKIADLLARHQRPGEAQTAYRDALRRDSQHVPALRGLANLLVRTEGGQVSEHAASLYKVAATHNDAHSGFMMGLYYWQRGQADKARALWDQTISLLSMDSRLRQELTALIAEIEAGSVFPSPPAP